MSSIAKRASVIGAIGVIVNITCHLDARGAVPRARIEVQSPKNAIGPINHLLPLFRRKPLLRPRRRKVWGEVGPGASLNSASSPRRRRGSIFVPTGGWRGGVGYWRDGQSCVR